MKGTWQVESNKDIWEEMTGKQTKTGRGGGEASGQGGRRELTSVATDRQCRWAQGEERIMRNRGEREEERREDSGM